MNAHNDPTLGVRERLTPVLQIAHASRMSDRYEATGYTSSRLALEDLQHHNFDVLLTELGYTDDAIVRHGLLTDQLSFIQKPFDSAAMARKVREVLDKGEE